MSDSATQEVFTLVLARPVRLAAGDHAAAVHLWWSAPTQGDRLVQVYASGELIEVSVDPAQRELWLLVDRTQPLRLQLLAVPASEAWLAQPELLSDWQPAVQDRATITVLRDQALPIDTQLAVTVDNTAAAQGPLWPSDEHRSGFGALFGQGAFGYDDATGPGLGGGELGMGLLGADGTAWRWRGADLAAGAHSVTLTAANADGRPVTAPTMLNAFTLDALPSPAVDLAYNDNFVLT